MEARLSPQSIMSNKNIFIKMRGVGKFTVGHCIKSRTSLILPVGEPPKCYLSLYILFETEARPAMKKVN